MKIWFEALTGKQALLFHHIATYFEKRGHQTVFTTRSYDYVESNLRRLGRTKFYSIGTYGGASLKDKLVSGTKRILRLAEIMDQEKPDLLITLASPDATRTAFGLAIPVIQVNDTPHARAVARLTLAISEALVHPEAIDSNAFRAYGASNIHTYRGVDEVLWIKDFIPNASVLDEIGLEPHSYIVVRCEESKAAYFREMYPEIPAGSTIVVDIIRKLKEKGLDLKIVAFPRYEEQQKLLQGFPNVIIPDESVDTLSVLYYASAAMTGGGTMGREGAMLGTPTLYTFPRELEVSTYVIQRGFPLIHFPDHLGAVDKLIELAKKPRLDEKKRKEMLANFETPLDGIIRVMENLGMNL